MEVGITPGISPIQQLSQPVRPVEHVKEAWRVVHQDEVHVRLHDISDATNEAWSEATHDDGVLSGGGARS